MIAGAVYAGFKFIISPKSTSSSSVSRKKKTSPLDLSEQPNLKKNANSESAEEADMEWIPDHIKHTLKKTSDKKKKND